MSKMIDIAGKIKGFFSAASVQPSDNQATLIDPTKASPERPILKASQDALERGRFVERLAGALIGRNTAPATGIVLGLTGSWGSGKSSILNLLAAHIQEKYPQAVLVRFDPWLISGRNDLIMEFIGELLAAVNLKGGTSRDYLNLSRTLVDYGVRLSPALKYIPHVGPHLKDDLEAAKKILEGRDSVTSLRKKLLKQLAVFPHPIVVLIDELDRVESEEIRTVAQLVRSVADFPGISYLLAYDRERVAQALGDGNVERGQAYLEKIVQLQIPLPVTFSEELANLLRAELARMTEFQFPAEFAGMARYQRMESLLVGKLLSTMRDIKRVAGTFQAILGLVWGEADWIDVLGYCALLTKAPATATLIRHDPERMVDNPLSSAEIIRRSGGRKANSDAILELMIAEGEDTPALRELLRLLFPRVTGASTPSMHADPLSDRRTLLTVLRLGILPGAWTREQVITFFNRPPADVANDLQALALEDRLGGLIDRLDDIYDQLTGINMPNMWRGIAAFLRRGPDGPAVATVHMISRIDSFANMLVRWCGRNPALRAQAGIIFEALRLDHEISLVSHWLHRHAFVWGLFGRENRGSERWFLSAADTERMSREQSNIWKDDLLKGQLLSLSWDAFPLFVMMGVGDYDQECRDAMAHQLRTLPTNLDNLILMLFGPDYSTDADTVAKIIDLHLFEQVIRKRLEAGEAPLHETVAIALRRALEMFPDNG
jgi:hypothetical protein